MDEEYDVAFSHSDLVHLMFCGEVSKRGPSKLRFLCSTCTAQSKVPKSEACYLIIPHVRTHTVLTFFSLTFKPTGTAIRLCKK